MRDDVDAAEGVDHLPECNLLRGLPAAGGLHFDCQESAIVEDADQVGGPAKARGDNAAAVRREERAGVVPPQSDVPPRAEGGQNRGLGGAFAHALARHRGQVPNVALNWYAVQPGL